MSRKTLLILFTSIALYPFIAAAEKETTSLDAIVVEGESAPIFDTHYTSPSTRITDIEVEGINASSIEDFVKYEPSLVVRRRYIGDSNGVVGMRGSNMFQTGRTLVFADGLPLHYLLQTRWSGAPRWGLVAVDETQAAEVVYGPFSAEYSGNAMGGVINIETKMPTEQQFHAEAGIFAQDFQHMGTDDTYTGHREFISYGDKFDNLSLYLFHNHLDNNGQPQSFRSSSVGGGGGDGAVSGAFLGKNSVGTDVVYYHDGGSAKTITDLTKLKVGYEFGDWLARLTLAYEDRDWETRPTTYLRDGTNTPVWDDGNYTFNGTEFTVNDSRFAVSDQNRQTLLLGGGLEGPLGASGWALDADFSYFDVMDDETLQSSENPADPDYDASGRVTEFDDTGWETLDLKARTDRFLGRDDMHFVGGYHYDHYSLKIHSYNSDNYVVGEKTSQRESVGGETVTHSVFAQWGWDFAPQWDLALGARYEDWETQDGFYYKWGGDMEDYADRTEDGFSPKFSLGFKPDGPWKFRYSLAKAYRFPIVEELYKNEEKIDGSSIADEHLKPEVGIHHNLMAEREIPRGFVRANLYHEVVDDVIWNQSDIDSGVSTFLPVTEVTTSGIEFVVQQKRVLESDVDVRFNVTYTDSEITRSEADTSLVGNVFPRMPKWRSNMLATWHVSPRWGSSLGVRYASDSFGRRDNTDTTDQVYGAQDKYLFVDLKANYKVTNGAKVSFGVNNLTDEVAFVAHPWPQRTFFIQGSIDF